MLRWLQPTDPFPPIATALAEPNGLLAVGGDLSAGRLIEAYRHGIFPWFNPGQPVLTLINPDDLWVRADVEESYIDRVRIGDKLTVRLPSGVEREGTVFYRGADASFATQRDVSRTKRDIKRLEIRLRVYNADRRLAVGMTAYVELPTP